MYVGNLPFSATELELRDLFGQHGDVSEVSLVMDRETNRPRGFAFVSMATPEDMQNAIKNLHGQAFGGRPMTVNEARPREERPGGFGGGGGGKRFGGGGGGGGGYGGGGGRDRDRDRRDSGKRW